VPAGQQAVPESSCSSKIKPPMRRRQAWNEPIPIRRRDIEIRRWELREESYRRRMRSMDREAQTKFNLRHARQCPVNRGGAPDPNPYSGLFHEDPDLEAKAQEEYGVCAQCGGDHPRGDACPARAHARPAQGPNSPRQAESPSAVRYDRTNRNHREVAQRIARSALNNARNGLLHVTPRVRPPLFIADLQRHLRLFQFRRHVVPNAPHEYQVVPEDEAEPLASRDKEDPGNGIIGYRDRRLLDTEFTEYEFDHLDFIGLWNSGRVGEELFVRHFGYHFNERVIKVSLPSTLVAEMKDWWSNRLRDRTWSNYALCTSRSRILTSELAITAEQQYIANLYGPAIGFRLSWDAQQNVARVVQGAHVDLRSYTWPRVREALQTKFGAASAMGVVMLASVMITTLGLMRAKGSLGSSYEWLVVKIARLVRIEPNPGLSPHIGWFTGALVALRERVLLLQAVFRPRF